VLSERLGTVPDVLRRALHNLEDMGLIKVDRSRITLLDRQALQAWAKLSIPQLDKPDETV
jgi:DNA-binding GntR family transcriptional regulator